MIVFAIVSFILATLWSLIWLNQALRAKQKRDIYAAGTVLVLGTIWMLTAVLLLRVLVVGA